VTGLACTHCGQPVRLATNNRILTPEPTSLGIYDPDTGEPLSSRDVAHRVRTTGRVGHAEHHCPKPEQAGLFDAQEATT
jgi:hypothetical protein